MRLVDAVVSKRALSSPRRGIAKHIFPSRALQSSPKQAVFPVPASFSAGSLPLPFDIVSQELLVRGRRGTCIGPLCSLCAPISHDIARLPPFHKITQRQPAPLSSASRCLRTPLLPALLPPVSSSFSSSAGLTVMCTTLECSMLKRASFKAALSSINLPI